MNSESAVKTMENFVSGKMRIEEFWEEFKLNTIIQDTLIKDEQRHGRHAEWWCSAKFLHERTKNLTSYYESDRVFTCVLDYFKRNNLNIAVDMFYKDRFSFLLDIQPSWIDEENFLLDEIINKIPAEIKSRALRVKWCKEKIKEFFKYDKTPPRWVQNPEWPIINGKPLVFKRQSKETKHDERVFFYFYDPDTKEETVVEQLY